MSIKTLRSMLLWCTIINYGVLLCWVLVFMLAHDWMFQLHSQWFHLTVGQFDALHYAGMALYKLGILLFNLVPLITLYIIKDKSSKA